LATGQLQLALSAGLAMASATRFAIMATWLHGWAVATSG